MKSIWIIALNTYREIIRDRILYGIVVFALLLIGLSLALGELSFTEQGRISANFGFTGIQLSASILAIFAGSTLVAKEIEKQTILTLLARPISRTQFLIGKYAGLILVISSVMAGLAIVLGGVVTFLKIPVGIPFLQALLGVLLEALLLTALALFFGVFSRPVMTVIFTASLFLLGHWVDSLGFFVEKSESSAFKVVGSIVHNAIPNLEKFNWRAAPIYDSVVSATEISMGVGYAAGWIILLLTATSLIFRRRDFV